MEESEERFRRHMPRSGDLTLIILKGHLLVEEQLNAFIAAHMQRPEELDSARLSFSQRVALAKALAPSRSKHFDAVNKLNRLRNDLAHRLESQDRDRLIEEFALPARDEPRPIANRLKDRIAFMCGFLEGATEGVLESKGGKRSADNLTTRTP
jgi:hypothetical protein